MAVKYHKSPASPQELKAFTEQFGQHPAALIPWDSFIFSLERGMLQRYAVMFGDLPICITEAANGEARFTAVIVPLTPTIAARLRKLICTPTSREESALVAALGTGA